LEDFGEVEGGAAGGLEDLLAAAETIRDDYGVVGGLADGGEEDALADGLGDGELFFFEAEGAGHAAAAGVERI